MPEARALAGSSGSATTSRKTAITGAWLSAVVEAALKRSAEVDARRINVAASDGKVVLSGNVHSWFERDQARRAAWAAPGVKQVDDRIMVVP